MTSAEISEYHLIAANDNDTDADGNIKRVGHYGTFAGKYFRIIVREKLKSFYKKVDDFFKQAA